MILEAKRQGLEYAKQKTVEAGANPLVWAALGLGAVGLISVGHALEHAGNARS